MTRSAIKWLAFAVLAGIVLGGDVAKADEGEPVVLRVRVLFANPAALQPKFECPKSIDPEAVNICMRAPVSFTVDVRDILVGDHLPRRMRAIMRIHTFFPPADVTIVGFRLVSGDVDVRYWWYRGYEGCALEHTGLPDLLLEKTKALHLAGRLLCKRDSNPARH